ncbi:MAG: glycosyltransferase family 4 protein [Nitrososphaera sp.]|jgi:glycosyltransferase involved in cell wall biosynthesis
MKIALIVQRFPFGGAESYVEQIAQRLHGIGEDVTVITSRQENQSGKYNFPVIRLSSSISFGEYSIWNGLGDVLKQGNFDVVHVNSYGYFHSDYAIRMKKKYGYKTVFTSHGFHGIELHYLKKNKIIDKTSSLDFIRPLYDKYIGMKTIQNSDHLIALSKRDVEYYKKAGANDSKISVIPPGIKNSFFLPPKEKPEKTRETLDADPVLISVGELSRVKAQHIAIKAMPIILKSKPRTKLFFIGKDRNELANLITLSKHLKVEKNVLFLGFKDDEELRTLMYSADLLLHTSLAEGLSTVLLESMACGLPFVTTRAGGNGYLAEESDTGVTIPFNDEKSLANAVLQLMEDKDKIKKIAYNGRMSSEKYAWDKVFVKINTLYHNLVEPTL